VAADNIVVDAMVIKDDLFVLFPSLEGFDVKE
jgi:hypothetical protein